MTSYLPRFIASGMALVMRPPISGGKPLSKHENNNHIRTVSNAVVGILAYIGAMHIAPRFNYKVPTLALVAGRLAYPEVAQSAVAVHFFCKGIAGAIRQGQAGQVVEAVKDLSIAAFAYLSTTQKFVNFAQRVYTWVPGWYKAN